MSTTCFLKEKDKCDTGTYSCLFSLIGKIHKICYYTEFLILHNILHTFFNLLWNQSTFNSTTSYLIIFNFITMHLPEDLLFQDKKIIFKCS